MPEPTRDRSEDYFLLETTAPGDQGGARSCLPRWASLPCHASMRARHSVDNRLTGPGGLSGISGDPHHQPRERARSVCEHRDSLSWASPSVMTRSGLCHRWITRASPQRVQPSAPVVLLLGPQTPKSRVADTGATSAPLIPAIAIGPRTHNARWWVRRRRVALNLSPWAHATALHRLARNRRPRDRRVRSMESSPHSVWGWEHFAGPPSEDPLRVRQLPLPRKGN